MHFYSWKAGLKTGMYYLRRKAKHQAQQFTVEPDNKQKGEETSSKDENSTIIKNTIYTSSETDVCEMCSA